MNTEQLSLLEDDQSLSSVNIKGRLEALLFASGEAVSLHRLATALDIGKDEAETALKEMHSDYDKTDRGLCLIRMEDQWQLAAKPVLFQDISNLLGLNQPGTLSKAALETLAIVAYRQPVTRVEIEAIRGVSSSSSIQLLLDREIIAEAGRKDAPGRPFLYKTTHRFLALTGLQHLSDLPDYASFGEQTAKAETDVLL